MSEVDPEMPGNAPIQPVADRPLLSAHRGYRKGQVTDEPVDA